MKFLVRLVVGVILLYILLKLGLIEIFMAVILMTGKVIMQVASISPTATAIGVLLIILMSGSQIISRESGRSHKQKKRR